MGQTGRKPNGDIRCGVIGIGRMGRHHARIYSQLHGCEFVGVVDQNPLRRQTVTEEWGGEPFESIEQLLDAGVDAVSIATPTVHHRVAAETLLAAGVACLVEKPLASDVEEARAIADAARRSGRVLQVGHIVRYDPLMRAIREIDSIEPKFIEVDRVSPMTFRSVDVGVVLDMMIHDLDLLLMFMGTEPERVDASAVCVLSDAEDVCNARLTFPPDRSGARCVANVTASRLALKTERKFRIISETTYISADFVKGEGTVIRKSANEAQIEEIREQLRAGRDLTDLNYLDLVNVEPLNVRKEEPLKAQIEDFLAAVRGEKAPLVDAEAGFAAVRTAERIVESARAAGARMV